MPITTTKQRPVIVTRTIDSDSSGSEWKTVLFNCYCHTFDEVVTHVMRATQLSQERSTFITRTAEITGSATVCIGSREQCEKVAAILGGVGLNVTTIQ